MGTPPAMADLEYEIDLDAPENSGEDGFAKKRRFAEIAAAEHLMVIDLSRRLYLRVLCDEAEGETLYRMIGAMLSEGVIPSVLFRDVEAAHPAVRAAMAVYARHGAEPKVSVYKAGVWQDAATGATLSVGPSARA